MKFAFWVAKRYFLSKKKKKFISIIANISMGGVAVGTMALIIVLSVFNGLEDVLRDLHKTFNPELKISLTKGKSFEVSPEFLQKIQQVEGVKAVTEVIEDNAVLKYGDAQTVVKVKGVSANFVTESDLKKALIEGKFELENAHGEPQAIVGQMVKFLLAIQINDAFNELELWYPKRLGKVKLNLNPEKSFNTVHLRAKGVFSLEAQYNDKYVIVPIKVTEKLLDYANRRTALEIKTTGNILQTQNRLKQLLGEKFTVLNHEEQQANLLRAVKIEKFFTYITLSFIILVASFNIFFSLMLLVLEKQRDINLLQAMGADSRTIYQIFFSEGAIIACTGAVLGLILGTVICWLQQTFGFIQMGTTSTLVQAYPVRMFWLDYVWVAFTIIAITLATSLYPAHKASLLEMKLR
ncbi:MAG: FtsX-like permease family protein [Microscillaceae bacterium]|nr:FtsX-like permease family protein [Microscillaceae bacterium]MDW8459789.1 FtsX-like permease family protein [Cytophagales bacterium]